MKPKLQRTFTPKPADVTRDWWIIDAADAPLGRVASEVAVLLRGKHKPTFAPHVDGGDYVIVLNADLVAVTGNKEETKRYYRHSGYPGGLREFKFSEMRKRYPERIIEAAVKGMLPKNKLGRRMMSRLKAYAGTEHPHSPQKPQPRDLGYTRKVES
jgi:large subunit ribosomal protein L13